MRKICLVLSLLVILTLVFITPVLAEDSVSVTVTASPWVTNGITGFTIIYVSETQLDLSWAFEGDAVNIMIRGKYGEYPDDIPDEDTEPSDGYLVYYGSGTSTSDTTMDFDENPGLLYYKAWGQKGDGKWYTTADTGYEESAIMTLIAFFTFAGIMSFLALRGSYWIFKFLAGTSWWALAVYWLNSLPSSIDQGSATDKVMIVLFFVIGLAFMFMPFWYTKSSEGSEIGKLRLPFTKNEEEQLPPPSVGRRERNANYRDRVNGALRGRPTRRRY